MKSQIGIVLTSILIAGILAAAVSAARGSAADGSPNDAIRAVLESQQAAWNRGDLEAFMEGYWKSDRTEFLGVAGVQVGWQAVLDRYRRNYPDRKAMGQLTFSDLEINVLAPDAAYVVGQFHLVREVDPLSGIYTLIFRKFPEGWRIVLDHTSAFAPLAPAKRN